MLMVPSNQEFFMHHGIVDKFVFDPGGEIQKLTTNECNGILLGYEHLGRLRIIHDRGGLIGMNGEDKLNGQLNIPFQWDPGGVTHALLDPNCFLKCSLVWVDSGLFGHRFSIGYLMSLMHFLLRSKHLKITVFDPRGGSEFQVMIFCISFPTLIELDDNTHSLGQFLLQSKRFKITIFDPGGFEDWSIWSKRGMPNFSNSLGCVGTWLLEVKMERCCADCKGLIPLVHASKSLQFWLD